MLRLLCIGLLALLLGQESSTIGKNETLLLFIQPEDEHFRTTTLPELQGWADEAGIALQELSTADGVPETITATPAIVFQHAGGRAIYASRYAELSTIKNFVRSNRIPRAPGPPLCIERMPYQQLGRGKLILPIKLTPLTGTTVAEFGFAEQAEAAFREGLSDYTNGFEQCVQRTDRLYYTDLHPYRSETGELYLSISIYSMFNCIHPVFTTGEQPLTGKFTSFRDVFTQAGQLVQTTIADHLKNSTNGDAWTPLPEDTPTASWAALGWELPEITTPIASLAANTVLPQNWQYQSAAFEGVPALAFRFPAPLDRYAGEVPDFSGALQLDENGSLRSGSFTAGLKSLTMGMQSLDDKVKRKYIYARKYPRASFEFNLIGDQAPLELGIANRRAVSGEFTFMGKTIPMTVEAELSPQAAVDGTPILQVHVDFPLNITDDFDIQGPDGPDPARKTLLFDLNFIVSPSNI